MSNVLVISGHPALKNSWANIEILNCLEKSIPGINIRRLDSLYPNYQFDIAAEQAAMRAADILVLQFPFYWYGMPALMKKWQDDCFTHGFSHGSKGTALRGKKLIVSTTAGAPAETYTHEGFMGYTPNELLAPIHVCAKMTGMELQPLVFSAGISYIPGDASPERIAAARAIAADHAKRLIEAIGKASI